MKTFDEAINLVFNVRPHHKNEITVLSFEESQKRMLGQKYRELSEEVSTHVSMRYLTEGLCRSVANGDMRPADAIVTAFMNGLMVGIEMEKPE